MDALAQQRVTDVEALLEAVEQIADPAARDTATQLAQALLDLYGDALERLVEHVAECDDDGRLAGAVVADELVSHVLLVHGLHPVAVEERVRAALDEVRPYLGTHGGDVALLEVRDGVAWLRLEGTCNGCPSSTATLRLAIEEAIAKAAPDLEGVEAEGAVAPGVAPAPVAAGAVELPLVCPLPMAEVRA